MKRILIVDDEKTHRYMLRIHLEDAGYTVEEAIHGEDALSIIAQQPFDAILLDVQMDVMDGLTFLGALRKTGDITPVIIITAYSTVKTAVSAMKLGATDFLGKPVDSDELLKVLQRILKKGFTKAEVSVVSSYTFHGVWSPSGLGKVLSLLEMVAPTDASVLVLGESGTGKEIIAQSIHENSPRAKGNFLAVNCAALNENLIESELFGHEKGAFTGAAARKQGKFEQASGGTLLLDEVGELPPAAQAKLLRAIQERVIERVGGTQSVHVDVRIIAATNRDLKKMVEDGSFREDLFFRLNVFPVEIPPLRERREELPLLISFFIEKYAARFGKLIQGYSDSFLTKLKSYSFPGNIRELENIVERAIILCRTQMLDVTHLPELASHAMQSGQKTVSIKDNEKNLIIEALRKTDGNKSKAAELLGIARRTLHYKIREYGLE
ncbi:sigma-54-dependent transcriptional regulator [Chrysiogenes arsenatis]|uniref:sigma-54-dependent transcriptional regulator n=1 Tax=Chrysiogenes arsenatis TaxID=309797 RepID=UPI0004040D37|nr:sigma-54 dependent transcriptional regulator [Chrysiogenes arsenatis]